LSDNPSVLLLLLLVAAPDPRAQLLQAQHRFEQGDYPATRALLRPLIDDGALGDAGDRNQALRLYGVASFLDGRRGDAEGALTALVVHDPGARLDPALYPAEVVSFFDAIRARHDADLAAAAVRAPPRKQLLVALIPFGVGQFQNQQPGKGWALAISESVLAASTITTFALLKSYEGPGHTFADSGEARTLRAANLASGVALASVFAYGLADALWYYRTAPSGPRAALLPVPSGVVVAASWGF